MTALPEFLIITLLTLDLYGEHLVSYIHLPVSQVHSIGSQSPL